MDGSLIRAPFGRAAELALMALTALCQPGRVQIGRIAGLASEQTRAVVPVGEGESEKLALLPLRPPKLKTYCEFAWVRSDSNYPTVRSGLMLQSPRRWGTYRGEVAVTIAAEEASEKLVSLSSPRRT